MTPADWNAVLHPDVHWKEAYAVVEREARAALIKLDSDLISTATLVDYLYPAEGARGDGITARQRIFKALDTKALATHGLVDCCTRGEPRKVKHTTRMIRPWLWHAPKATELPAAKLCPNCGTEIF